MTATNTTAKIAAVLAALGLVASSVFVALPARAQTAEELQEQINTLLAQIAALQGNTGTTAAVTFSADLTIGSTGADVTALQNWLISKGYSIPAGATGYFGAQTQTALAQYQAANGIAPAAGYFGPITRAKVNASAGTSTGGTGTGTGTGTGSSNDGLSGGEANLTDFDLVREESSGAEGESEVEVARVEFDVEDGDVRVERLELELQAVSTSDSDRPWDYISNVSLWADGEKLADMDADSRSDWDEHDDDSDHGASSADYYSMTFTGLDYVVEEDDMAEITVAFDIANTVDSEDITQTFRVTIADDGIRAVDAEGIQQYVGENSDYVTFGFDEEENGDLSVRTSTEDPNTSILVSDDEDESEDYTVFVFNIENDEDVDALITDLTIAVDEENSGSTTAEIIRTATLMVDGDEYDGEIADTVDGAIEFEDIEVEIGGDDEVEFELMVTLVRSAPSATVAFSVTGSTGIDAEGVDSGDETVVDGSATSATHTVASTGVAVEAVSTSQSVTTPGDSAAASYGTYTVRFDVTALEEDAYIDDVAASTTVSNGIGFAVFGDAFTGTSSAILTSTADLSGGYFLVNEGETETFTLTVTLDPSAAGTFGVRLDEVNFNEDAAAGDTVFTVDSSEDDFRTDPVYIAN